MLKHVMILLCSIIADPGEPPYAPNAWWKHWWRLFWLSALVVAFCVLCIGYATAHDDGQWGETTPEIRAWYKSLMQPDKPWIPCCGESDAYFADAFIRNGKTFARIVDDRPDEPRHRHHVPVGTEIEVPDYKLKYDSGNPVGHAVIFLNVNNETYCFVQGTLS